jgi:hypothetical protein
MADRKRKQASETEAAKIKKPSRTSQARAGEPPEPDKAVKPASAPAGVSPAKKPIATENVQSQAESPRIVFRDGEAYLDEYDIPIWRLEMARRAGSSPAALMATSPGLTQKGLDLAFAYAEEHKAEFDPLIRMHSGEDVPEEDEGDEEDPAEAEADLDEIFTKYAQVFRRLAE